MVMASRQLNSFKTPADQAGLSLCAANLSLPIPAGAARTDTKWEGKQTHEPAHYMPLSVIIFSGHIFLDVTYKNRIEHRSGKGWGGKAL